MSLHKSPPIKKTEGCIILKKEQIILANYSSLLNGVLIVRAKHLNSEELGKIASEEAIKKRVTGKENIS